MTVMRLCRHDCHEMCLSGHDCHVLCLGNCHVTCLSGQLSRDVCGGMPVMKCVVLVCLSQDLGDLGTPVHHQMS